MKTCPTCGAVWKQEPTRDNVFESNQRIMSLDEWIAGDNGPYEKYIEYKVNKENKGGD